MASEAAELLVLPPQGFQVWQRVVLGLERLVGHYDGKKPVVLR